jgi:hypothetical protein
LTVIVLDKDVAEVFSTPEAVNKVLRILIEAMPQGGSGEKVRPLRSHIRERFLGLIPAILIPAGFLDLARSLQPLVDI